VDHAAEPRSSTPLAEGVASAGVDKATANSKAAAAARVEERQGHIQMEKSRDKFRWGGDHLIASVHARFLSASVVCVCVCVCVYGQVCHLDPGADEGKEICREGFMNFQWNGRGGMRDGELSVTDENEYECIAPRWYQRHQPAPSTFQVGGDVAVDSPRQRTCILSVLEIVKMRMCRPTYEFRPGQGYGAPSPMC
jgi:hypothetical protein